MLRNLVISAFLCIFVYTGLSGQSDSTVYSDAVYPDTIATIWIIQTSPNNQRTLCKTAYDLRFIMEIVGEFFITILQPEICTEQSPADRPKPATKTKRI